MSATAIDIESPLAGYLETSPFPVECGGPRRQKATRLPGLGLSAEESLTATTRNNDRWNVHFIWREPGELYLYGTTQPGADDAHGWVERVDPITLESLASSPKLPSGGHVWCGGVVAHANGDLYVVSGSYVHRLSPKLEIKAALQLPIDAPFNGILILSDGRLLTKDLRVNGESSTLVLVDPEALEVVQTVEVGEPSMGRFAIDAVCSEDLVYVPGTEHLIRLRYALGRLSVDETWRPRYRIDDQRQGPAWDVTVALGSAWIQDNGDVHFVRDILASHPAGSSSFPPRMGGDRVGPVRLLRFGTDDPSDADEVVSEPGKAGWNVAPAVVVPQGRIVITYDSGGGQVSAYRYHGPGSFETLWKAPVANWWQPLVFADTGEVVLDDYRFDTMDDNLVVLDLETGREKGRTATGSPMPSGMFPCPGLDRDVYYSSNLTIARIRPC